MAFVDTDLGLQLWLTSGGNKEERLSWPCHDAMHKAPAAALDLSKAAQLIG